MNKYATEAEAFWSGDASIWPGCGTIGICMPCGSRLVRIIEGHKDYWVCRSWKQLGEACPENQLPAHKWRKMTCVLCGAKRSWIAPDGERYLSLKNANKAGWKRRHLKLEKFS